MQADFLGTEPENQELLFPRWDSVNVKLFILKRGI